MARTAGKSARNGGHDFERKVAKYMARFLHGYTGTLKETDEDGRLVAPFQTTRSVVKAAKGDIASRLHGDGMWVPWVQLDRTFPQGSKWTLECKSYDTWSRSHLLKWIEQANLNLRVDLQGDGCTAVIIDRPNISMGQSWVALPDRRGGPDPYTLMTLDQFLTVEM